MRVLRLWTFHGRRRSWALNIQWEPHDLWVGVFWRTTPSEFLHLYVCLVPLFPIHLTIQRAK